MEKYKVIGFNDAQNVTEEALQYAGNEMYALAEVLRYGIGWDGDITDITPVQDINYTAGMLPRY